MKYSETHSHSHHIFQGDGEGDGGPKPDTKVIQQEPEDTILEPVPERQESSQPAYR